MVHHGDTTVGCSLDLLRSLQWMIISLGIPGVVLLTAGSSIDTKYQGVPWDAIISWFMVHVTVATKSFCQNMKLLWEWMGGHPIQSCYGNCMTLDAGPNVIEIYGQNSSWLHNPNLTTCWLDYCSFIGPHYQPACLPLPTSIIKYFLATCQPQVGLP